MGGRLKAALRSGRARGPAALARGRGRRDRRDVLARRDRLAGRRAVAAPTALQRAGQHRRRRHDRRARPGLRRRQPAGRARGHGAAAARAPAPAHVRPDLRARRARLQRQQLAPRRVRDRDRLRHGARRRPTGSSTTTRPTSSARPPTTSRTSCARTSSSTRTRSCSGRFDGSGWFARKVDAATAAGVLWVNSAGNYRTRHWEGAWSDADADGNLDVPGDGNAFRVHPRGHGRARPATSPGRARRADPGSYYELALYQPTRRSTVPVARPEHAGCRSGRTGSSRCPSRTPTCRPGAIAAAGHVLPRVRRVGTPPTTQLTLYCRMDLSPTRAGHGLELPHARRRARRVLGRRVRRDHAAARVVLVRGPDRRRPPQARHRGADERLHHAGRPRVGRGQRLRRHLVRDAPRRRRGGAAVDGGRRRRRRRQRRAARARPADRAGARHRRAGRGHWSSAPAGCASTSRPRRSGTPTPAPDSLVRGTVALSLPLAEAGTLGLRAAHGRRRAARGHAGARRHPAGHLADRGPARGPARARAHCLGPERQRRPIPLHAARRQRACRACACARRGSARRREGAHLGLGARPRQRPRGPAALHASATARARTDSASRTATSAPAATSITIRATDRAGNSSPRCAARCAYVPFRAS